MNRPDLPFFLFPSRSKQSRRLSESEVLFSILLRILLGHFFRSFQLVIIDFGVSICITSTCQRETLDSWTLRTLVVLVAQICQVPLGIRELHLVPVISSVLTRKEHG